MRILAVTPYFPPEGGGLERYASCILGRLAAVGHDVRVLAATRRESSVQEEGGCSIERRPAPFHLGNAPIDPRLAERVGSTIRTWRPDVVVGHAPVPYPAEAAARAARRHGVPFVLTYHAGRLRGSTVPLDAMATVARHTTQRRLFSTSARLIAVSPFVRDHALARHAGRVTIIPPGVDRRFRPAPGADAQEILFVGPLSRNYRWKGVDVLWRAFLALRAAGTPARLRLVGGGDRLEEFRDLARGRDDVRLDGRLDDDRLLEAYQRAGVVVLPSTTDAEAFGMVLAEANACARPVVGSAVGGIPDFVRHRDNGLLAEPGDHRDLAAKLQWLLEDPQAMARMGAAGRQKVLREHDWDRLARQTEQVLEAAVLERPVVAVPSRASR